MLLHGISGCVDVFERYAVNRKLNEDSVNTCFVHLTFHVKQWTQKLVLTKISSRLKEYEHRWEEDSNSNT